MKRLWTAPFGLGVAAGVVVVIALVHLVVDAPAVAGGAPGTGLVRAARWPLVALGRNSLLVYFASHVLVEALLVRPLHRAPAAAAGPVVDWASAAAAGPGAGSWAVRLGLHLAWLGSPQIGLSALLLAAWWALALVLHRRGWYVRA